MPKFSDTPANGSAMLAIFCNLATEDQADFRPWLSEDMFPARLNIGFKNCASFNLIQGDGSKFVTLYETPSLGNLYNVSYQKLRQSRTLRDADYHDKFLTPERYTLAWIGPEISRKNKGFSTFIRIDRFNPEHYLIEDFNAWFVSTYVSTLAESSITLGLRRYISIQGPHKYFIIQEIMNSKISRDNKHSLQKTKFGLSVSGTYKKIIQSP
jgi:hypothetical protein